MAESESQRIYPHLIRYMRQYPQDAVPVKLMKDSVTNHLNTGLMLAIQNSPDPNLAFDVHNNAMYRAVAKAVDSYNTMKQNAIDRAIERIEVEFAQIMGARDLRSITAANPNEQVLLHQKMREHLQVDRVTCSVIPDGVLDCFLRMRDPGFIAPDDAPDGTRAPMCMVYIPSIDPFWWDRFFLKLKSDAAEQTIDKYARLDRFGELRRLGGMLQGVPLLTQLLR